MVTWFLTKVGRIHNGGRIVSLINGIGKTGYPHTKNEIGSLHHTENLNQKVKQKTWSHKTPKRKHRGKISWHWSWHWLLGYNTKSLGNKSKNKQVGGHQTKGHLYHKQSTKWKNNLQNGRKSLQNMYLIKGEYLNHIWNSYNSIVKNKNSNNPIFKMSKGSEQMFWK